ncbi:stage III sporulation protein AF [Alkalihalobacillus sp. AL-G]|uniref:stage III sporulation protein AF n=1 Tax=Alkalihalobacillus sp. AL-G TaxID=2926399 RepID=UPI002729BAF1|nr:stage III sporulation protein AF [Alkalihalobacillus sp. AL-G]WLD91998.1 stage III sporulation protein AF [Alkalihalobacillus sp. AL-G]
MSFIYEWITNIILIILLATILELLLPSSSFQKYIKVVIGLLLIIAILNPLIQFFSIDFDDELASFQIDGYTLENEKVKNLIEKNKSEIQAKQGAYKLKQMAVQFEQMVEGKLEDTFKKSLKEVEVREPSQSESGTNQWIIHVTLEDATDRTNEIDPIEDVTINTQSSTEVMNSTPDFKEIKQFLSEQWEVPVDQIVVKEEGGS